MSINATLLAQILVFGILIWFTMKFLWPPLMQAMDERAKRIADGLSAAERAQAELKDADARVAEEIKQARAQAAEIVDKAHKQASQIIDKAKTDAVLEAAARKPRRRPISTAWSGARANSCVARSPRWPFRARARSLPAKSIRSRTRRCSINSSPRYSYGIANV